MAEQGFICHAEGSMRHFSSRSPFTIGFCSPPSVTQHLLHLSPHQPYSSQGLLLQPDIFLCPSFLPETPASVQGTMRTLPLPLPFDWTCQRERFHGDFVMAMSPYTIGSMEHAGRMLETPVFELNNHLPVLLSTDQTSCSLSPPRSHRADANGKGAKSSMGLNPWASDYKPLYQRLKERQSMGNNNDIKNFNQKTFVSSSQTSSIQICELKLCRKDDAETTGSSSEGAICFAKEKWNEKVQDITGNQYDVSIQTDELHVKYAKESLHCAKDKTEHSSQRCSKNNGMLLSARKEAETQTDNCYKHKSLQTEWVTEKQRLNSIDCSDSLQRTAEHLKKEVQKLQIEVCHLRAEQCIKDLHRQILALTQDKMLWQTYFVTGSEAEGSVIGIIDERISWLHSEIKRLQNQLSQCLCKLEKGKILSRLPEFFLILPDNNVYLPAASARSTSAKTAPSFSDILRSSLSSAGSQSLKRQKFKSQDASKKHMNLAVAESALSKPSQNSCHFSFGSKENLTVFDLQPSSPLSQQSYNEHCPVSVSSPRVCENGCKKPEKQNSSVTSQKYTLKDSSLHVITANKPLLTEVINDDSAKYATCPALTMAETSDKENEKQQFESMAKRKRSEVDHYSFGKDRWVEKSSHDGAIFLQLQDTGKCVHLQAIEEVAKKLTQNVAKATDSCFVQENGDDVTDKQTATESADGCCNEGNTDKPPMKGYPQQSKKIPKTLPLEQTQGGSLKSGEREKPSLYQDAAVSAEDDHRGMSRLAKSDCHLKQIIIFATDSQKTDRNENATMDDRFQIQSNYAEYPRPKSSDQRTLPEQSEKTSSKLLDNKTWSDMGMTVEQLYYEAFQEPLDSGMLLEPSDQTENIKQNYKIPEKSKALAVNCEHEDLCLQINLKESVLPCFESDFCSLASLPGPAIMNSLNLVGEDALSPIEVSEEALDVVRLGSEADETSMNDNHERHLLKHVSNSFLETFDVDVEDTVSDDGIKFTATAAATLIDLQQSDRRRNSELITASSVSVCSSMAEGKKTDGQVEDHDDVKVHPSSDLVGHLNATLYSQHAAASDSDTYFALEVKNVPEQKEKKQENASTSAVEMAANEESETRILDHKGTLITSSTNSLTTGYTASDTDETLSSKVTVTEKLIEMDVSTNLGCLSSLTLSVDHQTFTPQASSGVPVIYNMLPSSFPHSAEKLIEMDVSTNLGCLSSLTLSVDHQTFTPQASSGVPVIYNMLPSGFSHSASCSGEVTSTASPTSTSALPTTFLQHHLQPLTLPAALQTTSHAELPSTDLQSSCVVASSTRLISSTLSDLDFPSDSNSSHLQEPSVQSSSTISSPLQRPGVPASVIFSPPQGPDIPGLEGILSGTNSLSPCTNDLYLMVLAMLTLEYPLQACDRVWLQKTAREQTQLLHTALQNQQGPLAQLETAGWQPPLTPEPSSAPALLVPRSMIQPQYKHGKSDQNHGLVSHRFAFRGLLLGIPVISKVLSAAKSPCHPQTTAGAPFAKQTSLQMSPQTCDVPPGFQKIGMLQQPYELKQRFSYPVASTSSVIPELSGGHISETISSRHENEQFPSSGFRSLHSSADIRKSFSKSELPARISDCVVDVNVFPSEACQLLKVSSPNMSNPAAVFSLVEDSKLEDDFSKQSRTACKESKRMPTACKNFEISTKKFMQNRDELQNVSCLDCEEGRDDDILEVCDRQGQTSSQSFSLESSNSKSERSVTLSPTRTTSPQMAAMNCSKSLVATGTGVGNDKLEVKIIKQDSSWPGPAIAKKSDDDDSSRASCQSGARVLKEGSDHPSAVHISHGCFIETPYLQLNSPTSSISLCKNSHDLDLELGCKIHTGGTIDQNRSIVTSINTLESAYQTENSGEWEKTRKHCKMDEVKQEEQHAKTRDENNLSASCHQKLVGFIMKTFPHLTPEQLSNVIVKVKEEFGGCLRGQLFSNITKKAKFVVMRTYPNVARSMNIASSNCAICHEEMTSQGLQKLTCGHFIHVQCITKWVAQDRQCPTCHELVSCPSFSY